MLDCHKKKKKNYSIWKKVWVYIIKYLFFSFKDGEGKAESYVILILFKVKPYLKLIDQQNFKNI